MALSDTQSAQSMSVAMTIAVQRVSSASNLQKVHHNDALQCFKEPLACETCRQHLDFYMCVRTPT